MDGSTMDKKGWRKGFAVVARLFKKVMFPSWPKTRRQWTVFSVVVIVALAGAGLLIYNASHKPAVEKMDPGYQENIAQIMATRPADNAPAVERADYYSTLGAAYMSAQQNEEAVKSLLQAEALYTTPGQKYGIWFNLAQAYEKLGNKKQAVIYYQKALDFANSPPEGESPDTELQSSLQKKINQLGG
ncbi:MAG TPA: tetratricopeptide repeat protein [Candidatus Saccharimonadales bacterium]|nr:tetratricopeptide repeat protein [Candidatus Saccharimonadales bacterium]